MNKKIPALVVIGAMLLPFMAEAQYNGTTPDITVHDDIIIMEEIWKNLPEVLENAGITELELERGAPRGQELSGDALLEAALQVGGIDPYVKDRIIVVLDVFSQIETRRESSYEVQEAVKEIMENIELCNTVPEMIQTLQYAIDSHQYDMYEGFPEGLEVAIQLLQDGEETIFNPDWLRETAISCWPIDGSGSTRGILSSLYKIPAVKDAMEIGDAAAKGTIKGAILGGLGGAAFGFGAVASAAAGAATGAIGGAADKMWDLYHEK